MGSHNLVQIISDTRESPPRNVGQRKRTAKEMLGRETRIRIEAIKLFALVYGQFTISPVDQKPIPFIQGSLCNPNPCCALSSPRIVSEWTGIAMEQS
jgi:hypothetical protein